MTVFNENSEYVEVCSKEEACKKLKCKKSSLITEKVVVVDLRDRVIGSDPTLVMWGTTPFTIHSFTPISVEINGIIAGVSPGNPFIYYPYKTAQFKMRTVATAFILLAVILGGFVWAPWSEPVIAETVQVAGYKSLADLPDAYLDLMPKLKAIVRKGGEVERGEWNKMLRVLIIKIQMEDILDIRLVPLYSELMNSPDLEPQTKKTLFHTQWDQITYRKD